jgi:hypothetical protein
MIQSLFLRRFRCFRELRFGSEEQPLGRVNLIAGKNNTGKTALLEAIFLTLGPNNPELTLRVHALRGIQQIATEESWRWLFWDRNTDHEIELTTVTDTGEERRLLLRLEEAARARLATDGDGKATETRRAGSLTTATLKELVLEYKDTAGQHGSSRAFVTEKGDIEWERASLAPYPLGIFLTVRARRPHEDVEGFSRLEEEGREQPVLEALRRLDPRLSRLAVLVTRGGVPMIYGDIGLKHLVPLPLMGEGMVRLLSILVAILRAPGGTLLLDEAENGLHYSVMKDVWLAIAQAARQADVQVFATTHSWECIEAAHRAFKESGPYEFRYHRLDRRGEDIVVKTLDERMLDAVERSDLEVR